MNYEETIAYLYDTAPMFQQVGSKAYKEGLQNTFAIDSRTNHPHKRIKTLHVAGTNGKGSISHLLASVLKRSGYTVGLYTSPHLSNFKERIRINGEPINEDFVVNFVEKYKDFFKEIQASFFELTTSLAFTYFESQKVDIAIIEVGLGGRLDCTNIITPELSIISNISFDHTAILGNTLALIAKEKAGIIKSGVPVIIGEVIPETLAVFEEEALLKKAPLIFAEKEKPVKQAILLPSGKWQFETLEYPHLIGELGGFAQEKNANTVLCAIAELVQLGFNIPSEAVYYGFANVTSSTGLQGRWQIIQENPKIVLDTGHNVAGIEYIARQLKSETYNRLHIVLGMVNDKDITGVLKILPQDAIYYFTKATIPRALDEQELAKQAFQFGLRGNFYPSVKDAFFSAKRAAEEKDFIFVGGSNFVVADALNCIDYLS